MDLDLSEDKLAVGGKIRLGGALLEVTDEPHTGCKLFAARFGYDAVHFINDKNHASERRRGINCRVLSPGKVCVGDAAIIEPLDR